MDINSLIGKVITNIEGLRKGSEEILFTCNDGTRYKMYHVQDCCECVLVEDVCGDVEDLLNTPIIKASEDTNSESDPEGYITECSRDDSFTWTFYNISTIKGHVTIRWFGTSSGFYSESVEFEELK